MEACSATSTSSSPAVTAPPSMLPSTSSPAASRPFAGVSAPTGTCFQDKATDGLAELLWAAQQQLVGQGHDRVGYHNADPKGKGKAQEMDPPPSLSAQQHIFGFQSHTPMQLHSTHAAAPPHCAEASLEATCCHPPHFRPDHNWTMALSSVPSSSAAQQAWADLLCCDSGHHACDIDLPCANVPCPVASTSEIPIGLAASHVALACTDPGCSEPICEPAKICCTEDVCDDEGMASVSLPACQTCPSCAGATTAQTGDNNGKVYSSFQELVSGWFAPSLRTSLVC